MLGSMEEQRDTSSPLSADSPSPSPVFLQSPQHRSSSSSACSLSSSGSDIVRLKDFWFPFEHVAYHYILRFSCIYLNIIFDPMFHVLHRFQPNPNLHYPPPRNPSLHPTVLSTCTPSPWPPFTQSFRWLLTPGLHIRQALSTTQLRFVSVFQFTWNAVSSPPSFIYCQDNKKWHVCIILVAYFTYF